MRKIKNMRKKHLKKQKIDIYCYIIMLKGKDDTFMNDSYIEVLVKKKTPVSYIVAKELLILITIGFFLSFFLFKNFLLPVAGVLMCIADYFLFLSMDLEYEYLFLNGSLQIDKILGKQKRKQYLELMLDKVEVAAPKGSGHLDQFKNQQAIIKDCYSGNEEHCYIIMYRFGKELWEVRIEKNEKLLKAMKSEAPRKVFLEMN